MTDATLMAKHLRGAARYVDAHGGYVELSPEFLAALRKRVGPLPLPPFGAPHGTMAAADARHFAECLERVEAA